MPIKVQAQVVDLKTDTPQPEDQFFVDTNVWVWVGYSNAPYNTNQQKINLYSNYINSTLAIHAKLHKSSLSFSELAHVVESIELEIFQNQNPKNKTTRLKEFRHDFPTERQAVVAEIINCWQIADLMTDKVSLPAIIDHLKVEDALKVLPQSGLDIFDWVMAEAARSSKITQIITDDGDFGTLGGFQIFTANERLIREAQTQGMLIQR